MPINRRDFLIASIVLLAGCKRSEPAQKRVEGTDVFLGGGQYREDAEAQTRFVMSVVDVDAAGARRSITPSRFLPHGIHAHPQQLHRLALFEKKGPGACEYDLGTQQIIRPIPTTKNRYFYGHGAYSADGKVLMSTEADVDSLDGAIGIRDSTSLDYLGAFPSYGKAPHECRLIDDGRTLVVTNGGGELGGDPPSVTYIDVASQKLLDRVLLTDARLNTGHLGIARDRSLVVVSAPRAGLGTVERGGVSIRNPGGEMETLTEPAQLPRDLRGEALSVAIHDETGVAAVTHPDSNLVTFWSLRERVLIKTLSVHKPRGVTLTHDRNAFVISGGEQASLIKVPVATLVPDAQPMIALSYMTGSHIYNWSSGMSEILSPGPMAAVPRRRDDASAVT
ncbi:hypothetical protein DFR24_4181 [Panacagrimonas perspica]|uniref:DUF1513 domain-containing protein n=1 Tax=Panacagrimonas perspica TaxID=381431 RepID=A0A4V3F4N1_9GAMM|nr:DUF1513 domain-containing protein [Panacagrimonas perspica]TDU25736.1 hypothetical protein DFR24_4181 [Panacagrimonas perspica]THD02878.1 hypothetical protein B1810_13300 [Panacagrimonas perspica]